MKLYNAYKTLILENAVNRQDIIDAITNHNGVNIYYAGDNNVAAGKRYIEPYVFGMSTKGNDIIRAYQMFGDTKTIKPAWKLFRVDRIEQWETTSARFYTSIDDRNPAVPKYNENSDVAIPNRYAWSQYKTF